MLIAVPGLALTVLADCGVDHGAYRHGYNDYPGRGSGDDYRNSASYVTAYGPDGRVYHRRMPQNLSGVSGYCG